MKIIALVLVLFFISVFLPYSFAQETIQLQPADDTFITIDVSQNDKRLDSLVLGDKTFLKLWYAFIPGAENNKILSYAYLRFNLPDIPVDQISSAKLRMYANVVQISSEGKDVGLHLTNSTWSESTLSGSKSPLFDKEKIAVATIKDQNTWYEWDVTNTVKDNAGSVISLAAMFVEIKNSNQEIVSFASKDIEDKNLRPVLIIETLESQIQDTQTITDKLQIPENSIQLNPTNDGYVSYDISDPGNTQNMRNLGFGDKEFLKLWYIFHTPQNPQNQFMTHSYLTFDISAINQTQVESAKLYMYANHVDLFFDSIDVGIHTANPNWSELSLTALTAPSFSDEPVSVATIDDANKWYLWDITNTVKENTGSNLSLAVILSEITDKNEEIVQFASKDSKNKDIRPVLIIEKYATDNYDFVWLIPAIIGVIAAALIIKKKKYPQKPISQN